MKRPKRLPLDYVCELCGDKIGLTQEVYRVVQSLSEIPFGLDTGTILHKECATPLVEEHRRKRRWRQR